MMSPTASSVTGELGSGVKVVVGVLVLVDPGSGVSVRGTCVALCINGVLLGETTTALAHALNTKVNESRDGNIYLDFIYSL